MGISYPIKKNRGQRVVSSHGCNEVCGIRDRSPRDQGLQARGSKEGISSVFERSGIRLYHFCGIRDQNFSHVWNRGSEIWVSKIESAMNKNKSRYDPVINLKVWLRITTLTSMMITVRMLSQKPNLRTDLLGLYMVLYNGNTQ